MPLVQPFTTSFGTQTMKGCILVELVNQEGLSSWSEIPVTKEPGYTYETIQTAWHILQDFLLPELLKASEKDGITSYTDFMSKFQRVRGHNMAKAGLEIAYWVLRAEQENKTLGEIIGAKYRKIGSGVSIGIQNDLFSLIKRINFFLDKKYQRIKIKVEPGWDIDIVKAIRAEIGDVDLMIDANSAYSLEDSSHLTTLKKLDDYNLMMIEQPLEYTDIVDHIELQKQLKTAICLDESIHSFSDARKALQAGACRIINIKVARVGGIMQSKKIADYIAQYEQWDAWCGGMLETGIGRMVNIFLQILPGFSLPGDTSGSDRYFKNDLIDPSVVVHNGYITPPKNGTGLAVELNYDLIDKFTIKKQTFH